MRNPKNCPHSELMENVIERDKNTGYLTIQSYRCVDCGKGMDAKNVTTVPPSKGHRRVFAIND